MKKRKEMCMYMLMQPWFLDQWVVVSYKPQIQMKIYIANSYIKKYCCEYPMDIIHLTVECCFESKFHLGFWV